MIITSISSIFIVASTLILNTSSANLIQGYSKNVLHQEHLYSFSNRGAIMITTYMLFKSLLLYPWSNLNATYFDAKYCDNHGYDANVDDGHDKPYLPYTNHKKP